MPTACSSSQRRAKPTVALLPSRLGCSTPLAHECSVSSSIGCSATRRRTTPTTATTRKSPQTFGVACEVSSAAYAAGKSHLTRTYLSAGPCTDERLGSAHPVHFSPCCRRGVKHARCAHRHRAPVGRERPRGRKGLLRTSAHAAH